MKMRTVSASIVANIMVPLFPYSYYNMYRNQSVHQDDTGIFWENSQYHAVSIKSWNPHPGWSDVNTSQNTIDSRMCYPTS